MFNNCNNSNQNDANASNNNTKSLFNVLNNNISDIDDNDSLNSITIEHIKPEKIEKSYKNLQDFITKNKCAYGDKTFTHNWWDNTRNVLFKVEQSEYERFLDIYNDELKSKYGKLHIMEKPLETGSLCLDFDVKINREFRCLEMVNISMIIQTINKIIKKYYKITEEQSEMMSFVLVKETPYYDSDKNLYSDGFHIQYPNLILDVKDRFLIFDESKNEIIKKGYFDEIFKTLILQKLENDTSNKYEINENNEFIDNDGNIATDTQLNNYMTSCIKELFDYSVIQKNCWFMYGSGKKKDTGTYFYKVIHIYDSKTNELDEIPNIEDLVKILAIRHNNKKKIVSKGNIDNKYSFIEKEYLKNHRTNVKNLFIKNTDDTENDNDNDVNNFNNDKENKNNKIKTNKSKKDKEINEPNKPINVARKLIKMLNKKRADAYNEWITVGWTLYNISELLLPEFIEFSKQDKKKYQVGCCEKVWDDCSRRTIESGYTIASLYMWAKEDNPTEYLKMIRNNINNLLENANAKADYDIAMIIKELYKYEYKCTSIKDNTWWQFDNHRWKKIDSAYTLGIRLSEDVAKEFALLSSLYLQESIGNIGYKSDILSKKAKDICNLVLELKKTAYKEKIIRESASLFYDSSFEEKLDDNKYLLGFNNGVYDLKAGLFRKGSPDDYINLTTDYDYDINYSENHPEVIALLKFLTSVFPDDELRKYVLCFIASLLEGGNNDQKMFFWTGSGSNGKGTLTDLINVTYGNYFATVPVSLLTVKRRSSSNATPELADKVGKRILVMNEPEHDDEINAGLMKELTGQDRLMARPLYGKPFYYIPQYVPILPCNHLPKLSKSDGGTTRRIRVIEFSQKFVDEPTKPNEHPKDPELRNKLKTWHKPFIWLLLTIYYPIYKKYGIEKLEPDCVKLSTKKYEKDSNAFYEFKEEFLSLDPNGRIPKDDIGKLFKEWHTNNYNERKLPGSKELFKYLEDELGFELRNGRFCGIVLKDRGQFIDDDDPLN
jgi:P4 family phage/plasmid primase-like protien